jgi:hypothetical protein
LQELSRAEAAQLETLDGRTLGKARGNKKRSLTARVLTGAGVVVIAIVILAIPFAWRFANKCEGRIIEKRIAIPNTRWSPGLWHYLVVQTSDGPCQVAVPEHVYFQAKVGMFYRNTRGRNELSNLPSPPNAPKHLPSN